MNEDMYCQRYTWNFGSKFKHNNDESWEKDTMMDMVMWPEGFPDDLLNLACLRDSRHCSVFEWVPEEQSGSAARNFLRFR